MHVEFESGWWDGMRGFVSFWCEALQAIKKCEWTFHKDFTPLKYETKQKYIFISGLVYARVFW